MKTTKQNNRLTIPDHPTIPFIESDGAGKEMMIVNQQAVNLAIAKAYAGRRSIINAAGRKNTFMQKHTFIILLCLTALLQSAAAQRLGIGLEAGTTGFGAELAVTIGNNLAVRGGFTTLPFSYSDKYLIDLDRSLMDRMNQAVDEYPAVRTALLNAGLPGTAEELDRNLDITAKLGLLNGKLLLDYYPWKSFPFHLTGGIYAGKDNLVSATAALPGETKQVLDMLQGFKSLTGIDFDREVMFDGYEIRPSDIDNLTVELTTAKIKPYLGLGFGRAVPKHRIGVSFEIGALFHGTPSITASNQAVEKLIKDEINTDVIDLMEDITVYPLVSLRLTGRILP